MGKFTINGFLSWISQLFSRLEVLEAMLEHQLVPTRQVRTMGDQLAPNPYDPYIANGYPLVMD